MKNTVTKASNFLCTSQAYCLCNDDDEEEEKEDDD